MIVISDTSVISGLIIIDKSEILIQVFKQLIVPPAVKEELFALTEYTVQVNAFFQQEQVKVIRPKENALLTGLNEVLDPGETEAITLAVELKSDLLLIDEKKGRIVAKQLNINITGLLGLLVAAKQKGFIEKIEPIMNLLSTKAGFWIGEKLYKTVLKQAGEYQEE